MAITDIIEKLESAGYVQSHDFPSVYYVKKFTNEGTEQFICISMDNDYDGRVGEDRICYHISWAGSDFHDPVETFYSPEHDRYSLSHAIWEGDNIIRNMGVR
jgi:hypothetical protein